MNNVPGVILAGGQARRMGGGDKCLLMLGKRTLLAHVIDRLAPQVSDLAINANGDAARFDPTGLAVLADTVGGFVGPLAGVLAAMEWATALGAKQVVTVAADTPGFPPDLVARLTGAAKSDSAIVLAGANEGARGVQRHPTFGLWPVGLRDNLHRALQDGARKIVAWSDQHENATAVFEHQEVDPFFNINTAQDMEEARTMWAARP